MENQEPAKLLQEVDAIPMEPVARFSAEESFGADKPAVIVYDDFRRWLLDKKEENIPATTLNVFTLTRSSPDGPILAELGNRSETYLAHVWDLLLRQANGESGVLKKGWNVFYVRDSRGVLCAVSVGFQEGSCPSVHAGDVHGSSHHHAGYGRFFSR